MKFQLKVLAAALALAVTLPAHAAIDLPNTGNGSLILTMLDRVGTISATFDLGKNYGDFSVSPNVAANTTTQSQGSLTNPSLLFPVSGVDAPGTSFSWNLTQGDYAAAWTSFLSVGTLANTTWGVLAGDVIGSGNGGRGYITTASAAGTPISTAFISTDVGNLNTYLSAVNFDPNNLVTNQSSVANGASTAIAGQSYAGSAVIQPDGSLSGKGTITMGAIGADLGVIQLSTIGSSLTQANQYKFANNAHFNLSSTGLLTYATTVAAPVPEADTWAMMFMGLGLMGFIARRKQS